MAGSIESQQYLMEVLKCSAANSCVDASSALVLPGIQTRMLLEDSYLDFTVAVNAQMTINFASNTYVYQANDNVDALENFLDSTVMGAYRATAKIQRNVVGKDFVQYHIEFPWLHTANAPHLSASYEGEASFFKSVETPWQFVISSTKSDLYGAMKWWLEWFKTNGNAVAIQHPSPSALKVSTIMGPGSPFAIDSPKLFGIAVTQGNFIYLGDNSRIYRFTEGENASVYAGSVAMGYRDGDLQSALFSHTKDLAADSSGNIYVCEPNRLRMLNISSSTVSFVAGGMYGYQEGPSTLAQFTALEGVAADPSGAVHALEPNEGYICKIATNGDVSTMSKVPIAYGLYGIAADATGNVYYSSGHSVRKITPEGIISVIAGVRDEGGMVNGVGTSARFTAPRDLAIGSDGNLYVADTSNGCIRKIALPVNVVTTYAGVCQFTVSTSDGAATVAQFNYPYSIATDSEGGVYVIDGFNADGERFRVREIVKS